MHPDHQMLMQILDMVENAIGGDLMEKRMGGPPEPMMVKIEATKAEPEGDELDQRFASMSCGRSDFDRMPEDEDQEYTR